jgi:hypothetical protein
MDTLKEKLITFMRNLFLPPRNIGRKSRYVSALFFTFLLIKVWFLNSKSFLFDSLYLLGAVIAAAIIAELTYETFRRLYLNLKN